MMGFDENLALDSGKSAHISQRVKRVYIDIYVA